MEMDNHGHQQQQQQQLRISKKPTKAKRKPIKVKYISSPLMVRASNALEFRAIVQELTGQNSDLGLTSDDCGTCTEAMVSDGTPTTALLNTGEFETPTSTEEPYSGLVMTTGGEYDEGGSKVAVSSSSFEPSEASFWREVSESLLGIHQFPCVLV